MRDWLRIYFLEFRKIIEILIGFEPGSMFLIIRRSMLPLFVSVRKMLMALTSSGLKLSMILAGIGFMRIFFLLMLLFSEIRQYLELFPLRLWSMLLRLFLLVLSVLIIYFFRPVVSLSLVSSVEIFFSAMCGCSIKNQLLFLKVWQKMMGILGMLTMIMLFNILILKVVRLRSI